LKSLEPQLAERLQQRASQNGRTLEEEITIILSSALTPASLHDDRIDLATAIEQRFAPLEEFELPEIPREPIRTAPTFS